MEDKIEVGEYVRRDKGSRFLGIGKVIQIVGNTIYLKMYIDLPISFSEEEIKECKHSKNITELIKTDDYVNGYPVRIIMGKKCNFDLNEMTWVILDEVFKDGLIEDIVTKEQFESMKYKV